MKKSQALGRGLDALFGEMDEAYDNEGSKQDAILEIDIKSIKVNPFQPRKSFDEDKLLELAESIKRDGLIQPIVVTEDVDGYVLVAGERRLRASKMAKLKTIRCIVLHIDNAKMREFALVENIQREDLNAIELAQAYEELIKLHNITHEELSNIIHKSRTHITNTLRLLQLSKDTQNALIKKKITAGHAKVLVGLDAQNEKLIVNSIIGQKLSVREVEKMIKSLKTKEEDSSKLNINSISYDFSKLNDRFTTLGFKFQTQNNKFTIQFDNENQIDDFLSYFEK